MSPIKVIAIFVDLLHIEYEFCLIYVHLAALYAQDVVAANLQ